MLLVPVIKKSLSLCKQITMDKTSVGLCNTVTHSSTGIKDMHIIYRPPDEIYRTEMHNTTNGTSYQKITNSRTVIIVKKTKQLLTLNKVNHGKQQQNKVAGVGVRTRQRRSSTAQTKAPIFVYCLPHHCPRLKTAIQGVTSTQSVNIFRIVDWSCTVQTRWMESLCSK